MRPALKHKMDPDVSPFFCKCDPGISNFIHCSHYAWSHVSKPQRHWAGSVHGLCGIPGAPVKLDTICLLLGPPGIHKINIKNKRLFSLLTFAARKKVSLFRSLLQQRSLGTILMDCIPSEIISCLLHFSGNTFYKIWGLYLRFTAPMLSSPRLACWCIFCAGKRKRREKHKCVTFLSKYVSFHFLWPISAVGGIGGRGRSLHSLLSPFHLVMLCLGCVLVLFTENVIYMCYWKRTSLPLTSWSWYRQ